MLGLILKQHVLDTKCIIYLFRKIKDEKRRLRDLKRKKDDARDKDRETLGQETNKYKKKMKYFHREANKKAKLMEIK